MEEERINSSSQEDDISLDGIWLLGDARELFDPPDSAIAQDWTKIAKG
jgi:hypothetical protein